MTTRLHGPPDHDSLTNALNQRGIENKLNQSLRDLATGQPFVVAHLDVNPLKAINHSYGRAVGARFLKQISQRIQFNLAATHCLARLSGGEFVVLFQNCSINFAETTSQKIIDDLGATPCRLGTRTFQATVSIGLVQGAARMKMQEILSAAAQASHTAKKNPHRVVVLDQSDQAFQEHAQDMHLIKELSDDSPTRHLFLEMQPIISLRAPLETLNFEVLIRMRDPNGGMIPASKIIAVAEKINIVPVIDKWVFRTTLEWLDTHRLELSKTQFVCINLSGMSLNDEKFIDDFFTVLDKFRPLCQKLCMEITEKVALCDMGNTRQFIRRLHALGVRTALDDFGTGYASFSYLAELPADALKIDGSFTKGMNEKSVSSTIVEALIILARNLDMKSIAEGVEDAPTLNLLRKMGADYAQGNIIAKPQHPDRILDAVNVGSLILDKAVRESVSNPSAFAVLHKKRDVRHDPGRWLA